MRDGGCEGRTTATLKIGLQSAHKTRHLLQSGAETSPLWEQTLPAVSVLCSNSHHGTTTEYAFSRTFRPQLISAPPPTVPAGRGAASLPCLVSNSCCLCLHKTSGCR